MLDHITRWYRWQKANKGTIAFKLSVLFKIHKPHSMDYVMSYKERKAVLEALDKIKTPVSIDEDNTK